MAIGFLAMNSKNISGSNPNVETRNPKWFDRPTILSNVEGQIRIL
jgi:hypothetical protein